MRGVSGLKLEFSVGTSNFILVSFLEITQIFQFLESIPVNYPKIKRVEHKKNKGPISKRKVFQHSLCILYIFTEIFGNILHARVNNNLINNS